MTPGYERLAIALMEACISEQAYALDPPDTPAEDVQEAWARICQQGGFEALVETFQEALHCDRRILHQFGLVSMLVGFNLRGGLEQQAQLAELLAK